jgi:phosphonate transport system substrate-binding protein
MEILNLTSCMAGQMDFFGRALSDYLSGRLSLPVEFVDDVPWQERERRFDTGAIQIVWICGLPYIQKAGDPASDLSLLAAPVMAGARYGGKPVYFSDIVVHRSSPYHQFDDLRGATWAINEPNSHSGHTAIRYYLARLGESGDFFGRVVESGAHEASLRMILSGEIDASAIDSTVLELEIARRPSLVADLRVLDSIGPSPIPPWLANGRLPVGLLQNLQHAFWTMHENAQGLRLLQRVGMARFVPIDDRAYDPLRQMTAEAAIVRFTSIET